MKKYDITINGTAVAFGYKDRGEAEAMREFYQSCDLGKVEVVEWLSMEELK